MDVEYREIPGFPGYRVGSDGSVWTAWVRVPLGGRGSRYYIADQWKLRKQRMSEDGRPMLDLRKGIKKNVTFHTCRLVLIAFVGPCPAGMEACHNDGNPANNNISNLRWDSRRNNHADKLIHGTHNRGEKHPLVKLTEENVRDIRFKLASGETGTSLARKYGVTDSLISCIRRRKLWRWLS